MVPLPPTRLSYEQVMEGAQILLLLRLGTAGEPPPVGPGATAAAKKGAVAELMLRIRSSYVPGDWSGVVNRSTTIPGNPPPPKSTHETGVGDPPLRLRVVPWLELENGVKSVAPGLKIVEVPPLSNS